jgi:hypothetical protein
MCGFVKGDIFSVARRVCGVSMLVRRPGEHASFKREAVGSDGLAGGCAVPIVRVREP